MSIAKTVATSFRAQTSRPRLLFVVAFAWLCVCGPVANAADKASSAQEQSVDGMAIVLGGSVMKSASLFLPGIRKIISESCRFVSFEKIDLALASLGDAANLIGGARVWHHRFDKEGARNAC
jgi:hypothetical protein